MNIKQMFIDGYIWQFEATRAEAEKAWKESTPDFIVVIVECYGDHCRKAFNND